MWRRRVLTLLMKGVPVRRRVMGVVQVLGHAAFCTRPWRRQGLPLSGTRSPAFVISERTDMCGGSCAGDPSPRHT